MEGFIKEAKPGSDVFPWSMRDISVVAPVLKCKKRLCRRMRRSLIRAFHTDTDTLLLLVRNTLTKAAKLPVLDGLYGGKACFRTSDKSKLVEGRGGWGLIHR